MTRFATFALGFALTLTLAAPAALARPNPNDERLVAQSELFLQAHPDLHMRLRGLDKLGKGDLEGAIEDFRESARHSDKPAQAILAELHWTGRGVPRDRGLAYVWMDLAAERGYPLMVAKREQYWRELGPDEREKALARGEDFYEEFGDAVARPRLEGLMKRAKINFRRSRAHSAGVDGVNVLVGDKFHRIRGRLFHDEKFWTPEGYFAWQDDLGHGRGEGRVDVGEVEQLPGD